jgi:hypothetical protein
MSGGREGLVASEEGMGGMRSENIPEGLEFVEHLL